MNKSLSVSFGSRFVRLSAGHASVHHVLQTHLAHCLAETGSYLTEIQITALDSETFAVTEQGSVLIPQIHFEALMHFLMQETLTRLNGTSTTHLIFHAAALALNDEGLILCGKSGSGKTTLTAWLLAQGFQYLTDEVISLPAGEDTISGFARSLVLKRGSTFIWQNWQKEKLNSKSFLQFKDGSAWIHPVLFHNHVPPARVSPRVVIFPRYAAGADFSARKLTCAETLFHLMQSLVNARNFSDHGMADTTRLAKQVSAFALTYSDIESAAQWIRAQM